MNKWAWCYVTTSVLRVFADGRALQSARPPVNTKLIVSICYVDLFWCSVLFVCTASPVSTATVCRNKIVTETSLRYLSNSAATISEICALANSSQWVNGVTVEIWEWISDFIPHLIMQCLPFYIINEVGHLTTSVDHLAEFCQNYHLAAICTQLMVKFFLQLRFIQYFDCKCMKIPDFSRIDSHFLA